MSCASERAFLASPLLSSAQVDEGIWDLEFLWQGPAPEPGQFFMVRAERSGVFLGRPISVYRWIPGSAEDGRGGRLRFLVALRGRGSSELAALQNGERAELSGPMGMPWPRAARTAPTADSGGSAAPTNPVALVGGGIGVAPVAFLASILPDEGFDFYAGFRSRPYGLEGLRSRTTIIATEDGCEGSRGRIPDFLRPGDYSAVYACGPEPMLKAVAALCAEAGTPCYLSLERRMACGVGACLGCTVRTLSGNRRCCVDGPVFPAEELIFDE